MFNTKALVCFTPSHWPVSQIEGLVVPSGYNMLHRGLRSLLVVIVAFKELISIYSGQKLTCSWFS